MSTLANSIRRAFGFTTQAGPIRWLWNQAKLLFRKMSGKKVRSIVRPTATQRNRLTNQILEKGETRNLVDRLFEGKIDHQQWTLAARQEIKSAYIAQYLAARGGRDAMTAQDWGRIGGLLGNQYWYLQRFEQDLIDGKLSVAQAKRRLDMYIKSADQAFERAKVHSRGMPDLPAYPGDGKTVCLSNCGCEWVIEETDEEWLCTWTLGATEHCESCIENAGKWNPLRILK